MTTISNFIDNDGKVKYWPAKHSSKLEVLRYIAEKFEYDRVYNEKEVNSIIETWHTFGDYFLLRRALIESKLLTRTRDGAKYWKTEKDAL